MVKSCMGRKNGALMLLLANAIGLFVHSQEWQHGFSECVNGVRTMYYYTDDEDTCTTSPDAVSKRKCGFITLFTNYVLHSPCY